MWVLAMFDLPTRTPGARKEYANFRKRLIGAGFLQLQRSVYARHCPSDAGAENHATRVQNRLPPEGDVRILLITDLQFARMQVFVGKQMKLVEDGPSQLEMF